MNRTPVTTRPDSVIANTSKGSLVALSKYSRSLKFLSKNKDLVQFSSFELHQYQDFYSFAVKSINQLSNNLRFGSGLSVNLLLPLVYFSTKDSFIWEFLWMN